MSNYTTRETSGWVAGNLRKADGVLKVELLSEQVLRVSRHEHAPFVAGIVAATRVETETVKALVLPELGVEIIANVPKESCWTGDALKLARENQIATGGYGDLLRVLRVQDVRAFQSSETRFIERGLRQHHQVSNFERIFDRIYLINRRELPDLTVAMLNEYELTAEHLRTARERYGQFSLAVITDPNGKATSSADEVALSMGMEILNWGSFFARLNKN